MLRHCFGSCLLATSALAVVACSSGGDRRPSLVSQEPAPALTAFESQRGDFVIRVSPVTAAALRSMGLNDEDAIAAWFNEPPAKDDPFVNAVDAEVQRAMSKSAKATDMAELNLSPATLTILDMLGVRTPTALSTFDLSRLAEGRRCEQVCRAEIVKGMLIARWTCINASVTNPARASQLSIDGELLGRLQASSSAIARQFLTRVPGSAWDETRIATLSVDIPSPSTGMPPVRWFKDLPLTRGAQASINVDVASAPIPSIGFRPSRDLEPAVVYAGDRVELFLEGGSKDSVWMVVPNPAQLTATNFNPSPSGSDSVTGLAAWLQMRKMIASSTRGRTGVLEGSSDPTRQIGMGSSMAWTPRFESPSCMIIALVRGPDGYWGMASRSIAVVDLRPGYWLLPDLPLASAPPVLKDLDGSLPPGGSTNIYLTHWALSQIVFEAQAGRDVTFEIRSDELLDASLPLVSATIDFGDGSSAVTATPSQVSTPMTHQFASPGTYQVTLTTTDSMNLSRVQSTSVRVTPVPPAPRTAVAARPASAPPPPTQAYKPRAATENTTFDLLTRAVKEWAEQVASMAAASADGRGVAVAHIHEDENRGLLDLMDSQLVNAMLSENLEVYEREPVFQSVLEARGFAISGNVDLEAQVAASNTELLSAASAHPDQGERLIGTWLSRLDAPLPPDCELLLDYKLKRAEVRVQQAGEIALRTARLLAFVRLHDAKTGRILADGTAQTELSDVVPISGARSIGKAWDAFPDGFLMIRE